MILLRENAFLSNADLGPGHELRVAGNNVTLSRCTFRPRRRRRWLRWVRR